MEELDWLKRDDGPGPINVFPGRRRRRLHPQSEPYNLDGSCREVCTEISCPWARDYGVASPLPEAGYPFCIKRRTKFKR